MGARDGALLLLDALADGEFRLELLPQALEQGRAVQRAGEQARLEHLDLAQQLLERVVRDAHVLERIDKREPVGEAPAGLLERLAC